ncbi:MAG: cation:proton antiporter [Pseudomonadota bacterium]
MDIVVLTTIVALLFLVIAISEPLASVLRLPYSVILAVFGVLIATVAGIVLNTTLTDALDPIASAIVEFPIRANVFLYLFLPTLLFQATLGMNLRRMLDDWVPILVMAIVAVLVATFTVGYALSLFSALPLVACLLVGAIVSTTDPSAVVSIFRSIAAPQRLARLIEGESLLNDAAAIALFGLFIGFVMVGVPDPTPADALLQFPTLLIGGAITGWVIARISLWLMGMFDGHELAQVSVSVALPYLAYIAAEQSVGASGVIAVVAAGLTLTLLAPGRLTPQAWSRLTDIWAVLAHWAGALIFVLAALLIPRFLGDVQLADLGLVAVVVVAAIAARAAILFGLLPLLSWVKLSTSVEGPYRVAILWGGLRGAVTLALALAVTENALVPDETQRLVGILATAFTLFTLFVQGVSLRKVIGWLGLDRLSPLDQALSKQVVAVALQTVREEVAQTTHCHDLDQSIMRSEAVKFGDRLETAVRQAEEADDILDRDRITLGLIVLAGAERDMILEHMRDRTLSSRLAEHALVDIDRLIEGARASGRTGYMRAARRTVAYGWQFRLAFRLSERARFHAPLARMTAHRFEILLAQRLVLGDIRNFIDQRIRRIHGQRVADLLKELISRRAHIVDGAMEELQLQYPGYGEELQKRFIRRTALRLEEREYETMRADGLIGQEVHATLLAEIASRRAEAEARPDLDIAPSKQQLLESFPPFAQLEPTVRRKLKRALRTEYYDPGKRIVTPGGPNPNVYFIASGAVEVEIAGQSWKFGRGEILGQTGLLARSRGRAKIRAITPTLVLVLDQSRLAEMQKISPDFDAAMAATLSASHA